MPDLASRGLPVRVLALLLLPLLPPLAPLVAEPALERPLPLWRDDRREEDEELRRTILVR